MSHALLIQSFEFMCNVHTHQTRKVGIVKNTPYIAHCIEVSSLVLQYGGDEFLAAVALLHDVLEDGENRSFIEKQIEENISVGVLEYIKMLTEREKTFSWKFRKDEYIQRMAINIAVEGNIGVGLVSLCDKFANVNDLYNNVKEYGDSTYSMFAKDNSIERRKELTLWFYTEMLKTYEQGFAKYNRKWRVDYNDLSNRIYHGATFLIKEYKQILQSLT